MADVLFNKDEDAENNRRPRCFGKWRKRVVGEMFLSSFIWLKSGRETYSCHVASYSQPLGEMKFIKRSDRRREEVTWWTLFLAALFQTSAGPSFEDVIAWIQRTNRRLTPLLSSIKRLLMRFLLEIIWNISTSKYLWHFNVHKDHVMKPRIFKAFWKARSCSSHMCNMY